ncbi:hypothetical protein PsorP6_009872 [Peronosclerospora sorghi]|uniref:Uncharacterized protein n=1 Tax=Peronosclerospora sorghi TaxID=230839 RepID=A0ACC0W1F6_9STRA|nr:hypothetical protein PsorP6_009872 [Peronosclerospora sorghi]
MKSPVAMRGKKRPSGRTNSISPKNVPLGKRRSFVSLALDVSDRTPDHEGRDSDIFVLGTSSSITLVGGTFLIGVLQVTSNHHLTVNTHCVLQRVLHIAASKLSSLRYRSRWPLLRRILLGVAASPHKHFIQFTLTHVLSKALTHACKIALGNEAFSFFVKVM